VRAGWLAKAVVALCAALAISAAVIFAHLRRSEVQARKLVQALASLDLETSTTAEVELLQERFHRYRVSSVEGDDIHTVRFEITNQPLATLKVQPFAVLSAGVGVRDGKVISVGLTLYRQVGLGSRGATVWESLQHSELCEGEYCVGNPIGKPFITSRLDVHATPEQKRRAFDLNLGWLTRFKGEPRICDLAPTAWEDWKAQRPDLISDLQATYHCR
jgi:methionine-rich copper-binding protein CopC